MERNSNFIRAKEDFLSLFDENFEIDEQVEDDAFEKAKKSLRSMKMTQKRKTK